MYRYRYVHLIIAIINISTLSSFKAIHGPLFHPLIEGNLLATCPGNSPAGVRQSSPNPKLPQAVLLFLTHPNRIQSKQPHPNQNKPNPPYVSINKSTRGFFCEHFWYSESNLYLTFPGNKQYLCFCYMIYTERPLAKTSIFLYCARL